jgi:hypothetical protein
MLQGFVISSYVLSLKTILTVIYNQMITRNRYIRDTYKELDISELPPGEVLQTSWNKRKSHPYGQKAKFEPKRGGSLVSLPLLYFEHLQGLFYLIFDRLLPRSQCAQDLAYLFCNRGLAMTADTWLRELAAGLGRGVDGNLRGLTSKPGK